MEESCLKEESSGLAGLLESSRQMLQQRCVLLLTCRSTGVCYPFMSARVSVALMLLDIHPSGLDLTIML